MPTKSKPWPWSVPEYAGDTYEATSQQWRELTQEKAYLSWEHANFLRLDPKALNETTMAAGEQLGTRLAEVNSLLAQHEARREQDRTAPAVPLAQEAAPGSATARRSPASLVKAQLPGRSTRRSSGPAATTVVSGRWVNSSVAFTVGCGTPGIRRS